MNIARRLIIFAAVAAAAFTAAASPALAAANAGGARSAAAPDVFQGIGSLSYFTYYLTVPTGIGSGSGAPITFHKKLGNLSDWQAVTGGTVSSTWPFSNRTLDTQYAGHTVVQLQMFNEVGFSLGSSDDNDFTVLRPDADHNYLVEYSLGGPNYRLIDVHASDAFGEAMCVTYLTAGTEAGLETCTGAGQTLAWSKG